MGGILKEVVTDRNHLLRKFANSGHTLVGAYGWWPGGRATASATTPAISALDSRTSMANAS
jgi:hypothetical protein